MKIFRFIQKCFFIGSLFLSSLVSIIPLSTAPLNAISLSCISMSNQPCQARPEIVNVNSNNPIVYPFSVKTNECSGNCNNINNPYTKICVPDVVKNLQVNVFNLMSRTNETKNITQYETCKCEFRLDAIVCNDKQLWNNGKCRCECKELIDKGVCDKGYAWNLSNCECECDKSCDVGEYLDYENCTCKKRLVENLVEECNATMDEEVKPAIITPVENSYMHNSCTVYIVLFSIFLTIIVIGAYFTYYKYRNRNKKNVSRDDYAYQTTIY